MLKLFLLAASVAAMGSAAGAWTSAPTGSAPTLLAFGTVERDAFATRPPEAWRADDPADSLYRAGREQLNRGDYRAAARTFARITDRFPQSAYAGDALYWQAFANYSVGTSASLRDAIRALDALRSRYPKASTRGDADALAVRVRGALAKGGDPQAAESVADIATQEPKPCTNRRGGDDDDERMAALNALLQMNAERALPIIKTVLARRDACSESLREKAVFLVSQLRTPETEETLLDVVRNDPSNDVRRKAVFWLGQVNTERAALALEQLLKSSSSNEQLREEAVTALMQQNSPRGQAAVRAIAEDGQAPAELREKAVFWLGQHRSAENAQYLRGLFDRLSSAPERSAGDEIRKKILFSLSQMRGEGNDRWLMDVASDSKFSVEIRKQAIFSAGQTGVSTAELSALYSRLTDRQLKEQLIWVLSEKRDSAAADRLMSIAKNDPDREVRKKAIFWLGQMNDPRVKQFLLDIING
jgi:HEAT repeat protein